MINTVVVIGRMIRDPELRYLPNGTTAVCKFTIAVDRNLSKEKKEEAQRNNQPTADFINVVAWGATAEAVANYSSKGKLIGIQGRIQTGSYEKDGQRVYTTDVVAERVEILEWKDKQEGFTPTSNEGVPF